MNSPKKYTDIFFDFDGTLIDSISTMYDAYGEVLKCFGKVGSKEEFNHLNGPSLHEIAKYFQENYSLKQSVEEILSIYEKVIGEKEKDLKPFNGATELLDVLHKAGTSLHLVTSNQEKNCLPLLQSFGWLSFFSSKTFGEEVAKSKPHPEIYELALSKTNCTKSTVIVIEDSLNGVISAQKAGLKVCRVLNGQNYNEHEVKPDFLVSDLFEAMRLFYI